jgi:hypothetical protein
MFLVMGVGDDHMMKMVRLLCGTGGTIEWEGGTGRVVTPFEW